MYKQYIILLQTKNRYNFSNSRTILYIMGANKTAGRKSATLIFVIPIRLVPIIIIRSEPAQVISLIEPVLINEEIDPANRTRPPWIIKTATDENRTPTPRLEASIIDETKSSIAFVMRRELSPVSPV